MSSTGVHGRAATAQKALHYQMDKMMLSEMSDNFSSHPSVGSADPGTK